MTHLEPFSYPVWDMEKMLAAPEKGQERYVLFDYSVRDPLTKEAKVCVVS